MGRYRTASYVKIVPASVLLSLVSVYPLGIYADSDTRACIETAKSGLLEIPEDRSKRFLGKVQEDTARCRGGEKATLFRHTPWVDWQNYYATGDARSKKAGREARTKIGKHILPNGRGIDGALLDLEYQRIELIKFNLFDQSTFDDYIIGRDGRPGPTQ